MTGRERILAAFQCGPTDRVPIFEQSVASDVASEILGRDAFTGTTYLHYQEAVAWMRGEKAHEEFVFVMAPERFVISARAPGGALPA